MNKKYKINFKPVSDKNRHEIESLSIFLDQKEFIETVSDCLKEADEYKGWRPVGIYDGDVLVGFAMYGYFKESSKGEVWLDRLLIDKKYQGKGYGKQATILLLDRLYKEYQSEIVYLSVYDNNSLAIKLYQEIGFTFNGEYDTKGESIMEYNFKTTKKYQNIK